MTGRVTAGLTRVLPLLVAATLALGACTTVPDGGSPQIVQPVGVQPQVDPVASPPPGAPPRDIVEGFLEAGADGAVDPHHNDARAYLTSDEGRTGWSDSTVTVVDHTQVQNFVPTKHKDGRAGTITVSGNEIGRLDNTGSYTPSLAGDGSSSGLATYNQTFGLKKVGGQWRIDSVQGPQGPGGLLVTATQFQTFRQYAVYFYDSTKQDLVPAARYTQLSDPTDVVPWLVQELAAQPPAGLSTGLPQNGPNSVKVDDSGDLSDPSHPVKVEIPGAGSLDRGNIDRLAAQVAATVQQVPQVDRVEITDGGKPVRVPAVRTAVFAAESMAGRFQPAASSKQLFYVRGGAVYQETGRRIPGRAGLGAYNLASVALTTAANSEALQIAGVRGPEGNATLDIPNPKVPGALVATSVHGELSRPSWAPGRKEVWIGDGNDLKRVTGPKSVQTVALNVLTGKTTGRVSAVRISPDGGRVALVLTTAHSSQIYVANIVRNTNHVSVTGLTPISPQGVAVTDVAWNDQLKLFATGHDLLLGYDDVYEVQCDGSIWNTRGTSGLPGAPESVTAASGAEAVVSSGDTLWQQQGTSWESLLNGENLGTNPVYSE